MNGVAHKINVTDCRKLKTLRFFFPLIGIYLLGLNVFGLITPIDRPREVANIGIHKTELPLLMSSEAKDRLSSFSTEQLDPTKILALNEIFAMSVANFWPKNENFFSIKENWIIFLLQRVEKLVGNNSNFFTNIERFNWKRVVESGY